MLTITANTLPDDFDRYYPYDEPYYRYSYLYPAITTTTLIHATATTATITIIILYRDYRRW